MFVLSVYWHHLLKCDLEVEYLHVCCLNWIIKRKTSCSSEDVIQIGQFRKRRWKETFMAPISPETDLILTEPTCLGWRVYGQKPILSHMSVFWIGHLVTSICKSWPKFTLVRNAGTTFKGHYFHKRFSLWIFDSDFALTMMLSMTREAP